MMFIAALSAKAKLWKEPKHPSTDEWIGSVDFITHKKIIIIRWRKMILKRSFTCTSILLHSPLSHFVNPAVREATRHHLLRLLVLEGRPQLF